MEWRRLFRAAAALLAAAASACAFAGPPTYPFGSRLEAYPHGIKVNNVSTTDMDNAIRTRYQSWKAVRLVTVPTVPGGKAVKFGDANYLAVSEGMGYGMLITVLMAGYDANAQAEFDALLTTVRARPAYSMSTPYLMDWRLAADGSSTAAAGGGWNAPDGDLDIAMALLMADRQWGSTGTWNYRQQAINTINAIKSLNMDASGTVRARGVTVDVSRTSDYMVGHFRAFARATGDSFWNTAIDRSYWLTNYVQTHSSPSAGLVPDFIVGLNSGAPQPSPGYVGDGTSVEMCYIWNAQRNPWRWSTDYLFSGDTRWRGVLVKLMNFFNPIGPGNLQVGYEMNGSLCRDNSPGWRPLGIVAGTMNGAQVDASYQGYLNAAWAYVRDNWTANTYYDAELGLLSMIVASGNWWNPTPPAAATRRQAETGALSGTGVSVKTDVAGYEGTGFVGYFSNAGDQLTVTLPNVAAGTHTLRIRYHAWSNQQNDVIVNGTPRSESFPATNNGWVVKSIPGLALPAGTNTIVLRKDWGWFNIDWVEIQP